MAESGTLDLHTFPSRHDCTSKEYSITTVAMANRERRETLRGVEVQTFDLIAQVLTSKQWAELLRAPLERAAAKGKRGLPQKLVGAGMEDPTTNRDWRGALRGAENGTFDLIAEILTSEQWAQLLRAPLERAAAKGKRGLAHKLVRAAAEFGDALHEAVRRGHENVVNDLLDNGASTAAKDSSLCGFTPLHVAAFKGDTEMVLKLLLKGAEKNAMDNYKVTPLYVAALYGNVATALALLAAGADVSLRFGEHENSVLHLAAQGGHAEIMRAAIERGAGLNAADTEQGTPLHLAARYGRMKAVDVLLGAGASIEARDHDSCTPLHVAAEQTSFEAVMALLKHGAHVNALDEYQRTPLHLAAVCAGKQGTAKVVDLLLRSGADETILNEDGKTAAGVVGQEVGEEDHLAEDDERVHELLANAPADRAWRRRGYLVLCRTHAGRMQQIHQGSGACAGGVGRSTRSRAKLARWVESGSCTRAAGGSTVDGRTGGDWAVVVARVTRLQEEGIFRTIVGFL